MLFSLYIFSLWHNGRKHILASLERVTYILTYFRGSGSTNMFVIKTKCLKAMKIDKSILMNNRIAYYRNAMIP